MILDDDFGVLGLDGLDQATEEARATDTCHVLEADLRSASSDELVRQISVVLDGMYWGVCDTEGSLRDYPSFLSVVDGGDDVAGVIEPVEDTRDIDALCLLDLVHQATYVGRYGEHT